MSSVYSPVFSLKTGWIVGQIVDHTAHTLTQEGVDRACELLNQRDKLRAEVERLRADANARAVEELTGIADMEERDEADWKEAAERHAGTEFGTRCNARQAQAHGTVLHIRYRIAELSKPAAKESEPVKPVTEPNYLDQEEWGHAKPEEPVQANTFNVFGVTFTADPRAPRSAVQRAMEFITHAFSAVTTRADMKPEEPDWTVEMVRRSDDTRSPPEGCEDSLIQIRLLSLVVEGLCHLGREVRRGGKS